MGGRRGFARAGKSRFLTVASPGVTLRILPARAKSRPLLYVDTRHEPDRLELPLGQALAAACQKDRDRVGAADDPPAEREESLDPRLRNALYYWGFISVRYDPHSRQHYHLLRGRGHSHALFQYDRLVA